MQLAPKWRPITTMLVLTALALCGALLGKRQKDMFPGPQVKDVGNVLADSDLQVGFVVRNPTNCAIAVRSMRTSCSCTVISAMPQLLQPGEECQMQLKIRVGPTCGRHTWIAAVNYDPGGPITYTVRGTVESAVPTDVWIPEYKRGERGSAQFRITATADNPLPAVESTALDAEYFDVSFDKDPKRMSDILCRIAEKPAIPYGGFDKELRLQIGGRQRRNVVIALHGQVTPLITARPATINFGAVPNGSVVARSVTLHSNYGQKLVLLGAAPDRPVGLTAGISAVKVVSGDAIVPITLNARGKDQVVTGTVHITATVGGDAASADVEYYALVGHK